MAGSCCEGLGMTGTAHAAFFKFIAESRLSFLKYPMCWIAGAMCLALGSPAHAESPAIQLQTTTGWTFRAAVHHGEVVGILASRDPSTVPTHTFSTIWFQRRRDGLFSSEGWSGSSFAAAAQTLCLRFANSELFVHKEIRSSVCSGSELEHTFVPMNNGVAVGDPYESIMPLLSPSQAEFIVEVAARGAIDLSALGVEPVEPGCEFQNELIGDVPDDSMPLGHLQVLLDNTAAYSQAVSDAVAANPSAPLPILSWFGCCWPGTQTVVTFLPPVVSPLGFIDAVTGLCTYSTTQTTCTSTFYLNFDCSSGPITTVCVPAAIAPTTLLPLPDGTCP
jgi:hypothetical protein